MAKDLLEKPQMIAYLRHALQLEISAYTAREMIQQLRTKADSLGKHNEYIPKPENISFGGILGLICASIKVAIIGFFILVIIGYYILQSEFVCFVALLWPVGVVIFYICAAVSEQNEAIDEYNRKVRDQQRLNQQELNVKTKIETKIRLINAELTGINQTLAKLYSPNILYVKYRDLVAVAQILEYYESGRRNRLEDEGGAYDLFEKEKRDNLIIYNLVEIRKQLNRIQHTQSLLYMELSKTNQMLSSMQNSLSQISSAINSVMLDSHITAYNSMAIASRTNATNYMNTSSLF